MAREPLKLPMVVMPSSVARSASSTAQAQNPAEQRKARMINRIWKPFSDMARSMNGNDVGPKWVGPSKIRQSEETGDEDKCEAENLVDKAALALQVHEHQDHAKRLDRGDEHAERDVAGARAHVHAHDRDGNDRAGDKHASYDPDQAGGLLDGFRTVVIVVVMFVRHGNVMLDA